MTKKQNFIEQNTGICLYFAIIGFLVVVLNMIDYYYVRYIFNFHLLFIFVTTIAFIGNLGSYYVSESEEFSEDANTSGKRAIALTLIFIIITSLVFSSITDLNKLKAEYKEEFEEYTVFKETVIITDITKIMGSYSAVAQIYTNSTIFTYLSVSSNVINSAPSFKSNGIFIWTWYCYPVIKNRAGINPHFEDSFIQIDHYALVSYDYIPPTETNSSNNLNNEILYQRDTDGFLIVPIIIGLILICVYKRKRNIRNKKE